MSWMSKNTGKPEEETGHERRNISVSNYICEFLDEEVNKSKHIENLLFFDAVFSGKIKGLHGMFLGEGGILVSPLQGLGYDHATSKPKKARRTADCLVRSVPPYLTKTFFEEFVLKPLLKPASASTI